ncbi:hypothetical protein GCM10011607_12610 [Shewanella inventionis]|uniref:Uncharacterized protein n=1 Tax=Shewanella inventionis TaxID=1738770 RepID=A0ABQ1IYV8_9GAMM|nr:hypothetical protein [Shewanella inventionis]GGB53522.1 hypothetical protein GCM10011607_12610 [Shewanella inventionis]
MDNLKITLKFLTPVIASEPIHIDAVLAYAKFKHTNDLDAAHNRLPIKKTNGVYHASALRLQSPARIVKADFNGSLRPQDMNTRLFAPNALRGSKYLYIDTARGEHKAELNSYIAYESLHSTGYFFVVGDKDEIETLLNTYVFGIGKKSHAGFGQIESISIEIIDEDKSIYCDELGVMRNTPMHVFKELGYKKTSIVDSELATYFPPYYKTEPVECVVPSSLFYDKLFEVAVDDFF